MARRRNRPLKDRAIRVRSGGAVRRRSRIPDYTGDSAQTLSNSDEDGFFTKSITLADKATDKARNNKGKIHASSLLYDFCPRRFALANIPKFSSPIIDEQPTSNDRLMWAIGRAVEAHIRNNLIKSLGRKRFMGEWKCLCGDTKIKGQFESGKICKLCNYPVDRYDEYTVEYKGIIGNPDMVFITNLSKLLVMEIKSKKKKGDDGFDELTKPEVLHVLQACIYRRLIHLHGYEVDDHVVVIYGCKDYAYKGSPYKEYKVDASIYDKLVNNLFSVGAKAINSVLDYDRIKRLPERLESCSHISTPRAKKCDACALCFNLKK